MVLEYAGSSRIAPGIAGTISGARHGASAAGAARSSLNGNCPDSTRLLRRLACDAHARRARAPHRHSGARRARRRARAPVHVWPQLRLDKLRTALTDMRPSHTGSEHRKLFGMKVVPPTSRCVFRARAAACRSACAPCLTRAAESPAVPRSPTMPPAKPSVPRPRPLNSEHTRAEAATPWRILARVRQRRCQLSPHAV